jgi:hypothetical protein
VRRERAERDGETRGESSKPEEDALHAPTIIERPRRWPSCESLRRR